MTLPQFFNDHLNHGKPFGPVDIISPDLTGCYAHFSYCNASYSIWYKDGTDRYGAIHWPAWDDGWDKAYLVEVYDMLNGGTHLASLREEFDTMAEAKADIVNKLMNEELWETSLGL